MKTAFTMIYTGGKQHHRHRMNIYNNRCRMKTTFKMTGTGWTFMTGIGWTFTMTGTRWTFMTGTGWTLTMTGTGWTFTMKLLLKGTGWTFTMTGTGWTFTMKGTGWTFTMTGTGWTFTMTGTGWRHHTERHRMKTTHWKAQDQDSLNNGWHSMKTILIMTVHNEDYTHNDSTQWRLHS